MIRFVIPALSRNRDGDVKIPGQARNEILFYTFMMSFSFASIKASTRLL